MNLKWLFGTGLLATVIFFGAIYFGMKYDWVNGSSPSTSSTTENSQIKLKIDKNQNTTSQIPKASEKTDGSAGLALIDEDEESIAALDNLGSSDLKIEDIVAQCQRISQSVGIPESKIEQAIIECVDRNSRHLTTEKPADDRDIRVREQCNIAITQKDLLSDEEIKMLVDECVASMTTE